MKIKTKDGGRLHLQAPSKLTGDYDPDFESTVDDGVAAGMSVSKRGGWAIIRVSSSVVVKGGRVSWSYISVVHTGKLTSFSNDLCLRNAGVLKQQHLSSVPMIVVRGVVRMKLTVMKCQTRVNWMKQIKTCSRVSERERFASSLLLLVSARECQALLA